LQLPLTDNERTFLRKGRIKIADLVHYSVEELSEILRCEEERARKLIGLAVFQQVPSIGRIGAAMMVDELGFYTLDELKSQDFILLLIGMIYIHVMVFLWDRNSRNPFKCTLGDCLCR